MFSCVLSWQISGAVFSNKVSPAVQYRSGDRLKVSPNGLTACSLVKVASLRLHGLRNDTCWALPGKTGWCSPTSLLVRSLDCHEQQKTICFCDKNEIHNQSLFNCSINQSHSIPLFFGFLHGRCYCGEAHEKYDKHGHEICDQPCSGDSSLICGSFEASNVFSIY